MLSLEDRASKATAECVAKNGGENVEFYFVKALHEHGNECYAAGLEAAAKRVERWPYGSTTEYTKLQNIAADIRAPGKEGN